MFDELEIAHESIMVGGSVSDVNVYADVYQTCGSAMVFQGVESISKIVGDVRVTEHPTEGLTIERFDSHGELDSMSRFNKSGYSHFSLRTKSSFNNY